MKEDLLQKIYDCSNAGLDIICEYYPDARECVNGNKKLFKMRDEKTASASIKKIKNIYRVTDFGDDSTALSPIDIVMRNDSLAFKDALYRLADKYNIQKSLDAKLNKPDFKSREAAPEETEGLVTYELKEEFTEQELALLGPSVKQETCKKYSYFSVKSITRIKNRKAITTLSNEYYPIFLHDCGEFKKVYQPLNSDKAYRFFYIGTKPKNYINGLDALKKAHKKFIDDQESYFEDEDAPRKPAKQKLPEAIFCSGERDALTVAGYGYYPLWLNSETARLEEKEYNEITKLVDEVYNIPDIDDTGIKKANELALKYLDIRTVYLPEWLRNFKDNRGRSKKDLRDFVEHRPSISEFKALLRTAPKCCFWEKVATKEGSKLEINTIYLINFLKANGYYTLIDKDTKKITFIHVDRYKVEEVAGKQARSFIMNYLRTNNIDLDIQNLVLNSKRTGVAMLDDLPEAKLDFCNHTIDSQTLFFQNIAINVSSSNITEIRNNDIKNHVWADNICKHNFKRLSPAFTYSEENELNFDIKNTKSHFFRFIINSSRIYWREEYEHRASGNFEQDEKYINDNKFNIFGDRLSEDEKLEHLKILLNKLFAIGYLVHSSKVDSKALGLWLLEAKETAESESSGGSGKSFFVKFLSNLKKITTLDGRNRKLTDNQHIFERVNEHTDIINIDDAHQYFDFDFFYSLITGSMTINAKHTKSKEISFEQSPKLVVTSNFPPRSHDGSTMRRLLMVIFSDYYHKSTEDNDYNEDRSINSDFGYDLHNVTYKEESWNEDFNFIVDCLQFYLSCIKQNIVMHAPMSKIRTRMFITAMGQHFLDWANVYFAESSDKLDRMLVKKDLLDEFLRETNLKGWSSNKFTRAIKAFAEYSSYIECYNPSELATTHDKSRIVRKIVGKTTDMIYLKTYFCEINDELKI